MHVLWSVLASGSGPQKKVPTSVARCCSASEAKMRSQLGRPYCARCSRSRFSTETSLTFMDTLERERGRGGRARATHVRRRPQLRHGVELVADVVGVDVDDVVGVNAAGEVGVDLDALRGERRVSSRRGDREGRSGDDARG